MEHKPPTAVIQAAHGEHSLPLHDTTDFDDADRGFIAALSPCVIKAADGRVVWDNDAYSFLDGAAPTSVHPSLWRLPGDLSILTPSPASDTDTVTVTAATAARWNLKTIADLAPHSADVKFAAPSAFQTRPSGLPGLRHKYSLDIAPGNFVTINDGGGAVTVRALVEGTATAANLFSTSAAIPQNHLVVLEDPEHNFLAGNIVPLVNSRKKSDHLKDVLDAVSAKLTTAGLAELNAAVSGNSGVDPDQAARKWVRDNGFDHPVRQ